MIKDRYGRVMISRHDLYEMIYSGDDISNVTEVDWHDDLEKYNTALITNHLSDIPLRPLKKLNLDVSDFDIENQQNWFVPAEYLEIDIKKYILDKTPTEGIERVRQELELYDKYGLENILRMCVYIVDTFRKNNIVWGVGRGSSVASYVLYVIGIHKVDSIKYGLDIHEFLK